MYGVLSYYKCKFKSVRWGNIHYSPVFNDKAGFFRTCVSFEHVLCNRLNENLLFWESPPYKCNAGPAMQQSSGIRSKVSFSNGRRLFQTHPDVNQPWLKALGHGWRNNIFFIKIIMPDRRCENKASPARSYEQVSFSQ